jgi:hypothetical protein
MCGHYTQKNRWQLVCICTSVVHTQVSSVGKRVNTRSSTFSVRIIAPAASTAKATANTSDCKTKACHQISVWCIIVIWKKYRRVTAEEVLTETTESQRILAY